MRCARIGKHDARARAREIASALIDVIVAGEQKNALADGDRVAIEIGGDRRGGQDRPEGRCCRTPAAARSRRSPARRDRRECGAGAGAACRRRARTAADDPEAARPPGSSSCRAARRRSCASSARTLGRLRSSADVSVKPSSRAGLPPMTLCGADSSQPPGSFCSSSSRTLRPARPASSAASRPAAPPPTTSTSV